MKTLLTIFTLVFTVFIGSFSITLAETFFDKCMRKYSPPAGPNYGFMAAQAACHAAMTRYKNMQRAALCVAAGSKSIQSPAGFNALVTRCYGNLPVDPEIKMYQCIFPNYLKIRTRAEMDVLIQKCKH